MWAVHEFFQRHALPRFPLVVTLVAGRHLFSCNHLPTALVSIRPCGPSANVHVLTYKSNHRMSENCEVVKAALLVAKVVSQERRQTSLHLWKERMQTADPPKRLFRDQPHLRQRQRSGLASLRCSQRTDKKLAFLPDALSQIVARWIAESQTCLLVSGCHEMREEVRSTRLLYVYEREYVSVALKV